MRLKVLRRLRWDGKSLQPGFVFECDSKKECKRFILCKNAEETKDDITKPVVKEKPKKKKVDK